MINQTIRKCLLTTFTSMAAVALVAPANAAGDDNLIYKPGAQYQYYSGAWTKGVDLQKLKPVATNTINVGREKNAIKPAAKGDSFVVVKGLLKIDRAGTYRYNPGTNDSAFNVMTIGGKQVSRMDMGAGKSTQTAVTLSAGHHPFEIIFFKTSTPFAIARDVDGSGQYDALSDSDIWHTIKFKPTMQTELLAAITTLKSHIEKKTEPPVKEVESLKKVIDQYHDLLGYNETIIKAALDLVTTYDKVKGPLFVARDGWDKGHRRKPTPPAIDVDWTLYHVMQHMMDYVYTAKNLERHGALLNGFKFGCSAHFPGAVDPPADPQKVYTVKINAVSPKMVSFTNYGPPRKPTGAYAAPGSIVTVTVPKSLVGKGYLIRVGAHSWDNTRKRRVTRLARASLVYPIDQTETQVANPLGGGIYIEVPVGSADGVVELTLKNAVRAPYFSAKSFHKTTLKQWLEVERNRQAPWADFESDKFMMQVPTSWISKLDDPVTLIKNWDMAMDAINDLMGQPRIGTRHTMYLQVDLQNRSRVFAPGYPTCNDRYDPNKDYGGYANHYLVRGPQYAPNYVFHEQGHAFMCVKYAGEMESTVNLPHVAVWHQKFGYSLDDAFSSSRGGVTDKHHTREHAAISWMTSFNFIDGNPMKNFEKQYQWKGHAKYVDIARLFGWKVLGDFWKSYNDDVAKGIYPGRRGYKDDEITLRKCKVIGSDVTPLMHFWGVHPQNADALKAAIAAEKIPASAKIYDTLVHYKSIVPKNNKAFREFAQSWWSKQPNPKGYTTEKNHAAQWDAYNEKRAAKVAARVQSILDLYFPNGRPTESR